MGWGKVGCFNLKKYHNLQERIFLDFQGNENEAHCEATFITKSICILYRNYLIFSSLMKFFLLKYLILSILKKKKKTKANRLEFLILCNYHEIVKKKLEISMTSQKPFIQRYELEVDGKMAG